MFAPEELELLVCGSKILDFDAMEKATHYDGYEANDPVIRCATLGGHVAVASAEWCAIILTRFSPLFPQQLLVHCS